MIFAPHLISKAPHELGGALLEFLRAARAKEKSAPPKNFLCIRPCSSIYLSVSLWLSICQLICLLVCLSIFQSIPSLHLYLSTSLAL